MNVSYTNLGLRRIGSHLHLTFTIDSQKAVHSNENVRPEFYFTSDNILQSSRKDV